MYDQAQGHGYSIHLTSCLQRNYLELSKLRVIAIKKPGKTGEEASHFRPISFLNITFKLLERLIFNRIGPAIDEATPIEQGGFRESRSCVDQIVTFTTKIESSFQRQEKVWVAFVDLTSAYDTVWRHGLLLKCIRVLIARG